MLLRAVAPTLARARGRGSLHGRGFAVGVTGHSPDPCRPIYHFSTCGIDAGSLSSR